MPFYPISANTKNESTIGLAIMRGETTIKKKEDVIVKKEIDDIMNEVTNQPNVKNKRSRGKHNSITNS